MGIKYTGAFKVSGTTKVGETVSAGLPPPPDFSDVATETKVVAINPVASARLGWSAAIDNDTCIVGAYSANSVGELYAYTKNGEEWDTQLLMTGTTTRGRNIGYSVDISGDTCIAGAYLDSGDGVNSGAVFVFTRTNGIWSEQQRIVSPNPISSGRFGLTVAIDGDTCLITAAAEVGVSGSKGVVYVFTRTDGVWTEQAILEQDNNAIAPNDDFDYGESMAIEGDMCLIGSPKEEIDNTINVGAVYAFARTDGVWAQTQRMQATEGTQTQSSYFGRSVSLSGNTCVIGEEGYKRNSSDVSGHGTAYIYTLVDGVWSDRQQLDPAVSQSSGSDYGYSVSIENNTCVVGAPRQLLSGASSAGAAYVFTRTDGVWTDAQNFVATDYQSSDNFGWSVSLSGNSFISGSPREDSGGSDAGAAYIYTATSTINAWRP